MNKSSKYLDDYIDRSRGQLIEDFGILLGRSIEERRKTQKVDQVIEARKETIRRLLNQKAAFNRMIKIENFNRTLIEVVTKENRKLSIKELKKKILKLEKIMETIAYYGGSFSEESLSYLEREFNILMGLLEKKKEIFIKSLNYE